MAKISKDMTIGELIAMDTNIIGILMDAQVLEDQINDYLAAK